VTALVNGLEATAIAARGFTGNLSPSFSLLSEVEQKTESAKIGVLPPVAFAAPRARGRFTGAGRTSYAIGGEVIGVAMTLGLRTNGGRTLLLFRDLRSLIMTGGAGLCVAGKENALRSRGRGFGGDNGEETSDDEGTGTSGATDGRLACFLTGEVDFSDATLGEGEVMMGGTGEVMATIAAEGVDGRMSASLHASEQ
jgi:hypothetical protein